MRMFYTDFGSLSLKEIDRIEDVSSTTYPFKCLEIDQGSGTQSLNHKSDLEFGFEALQGGIINWNEVRTGL